MKKIRLKRQQWLARQMHIRHKARLLYANTARHKRFQHVSPRGIKHAQTSTSVFKVPSNLLAERYSDRSKILDILWSALNVLGNTNSRVKFDFSRVERCFPGGMLMLMAFLELLVDSFPNRVTARCPPGSMSGQLLNHFGIGSKLGVSSTACHPRHDSVVNWHYVTGTKLDGSKISELLKKYKELSDAEPPEGLYDVLGEALTNVHHHAYPDKSATPELLRRWWMFSRYDSPGADGPGSLYIAIYDIGEGIQNTMRKKLSTGELILNLGESVSEVLGFNLKVLDKILLEK